MKRNRDLVLVLKDEIISGKNLTSKFKEPIQKEETFFNKIP